MKTVRCGGRSAAVFLILHSAFCILPFSGLAQQPAPPLPDEEDIPEPDDSWDFTSRPGLSASMRQMLDKLVAVGRAHEGLRYPIYSDGKVKVSPAREAEFQSGRVSRLDETWVQFTKALFQSFGDPAAPDTATRTVALENAIYDIRYDMIFTDSPVQIEDKAGSIHSGAMLHDRATGITIFSGGVELFLQEMPDLAPQAAPLPTPTPAVDLAPAPAVAPPPAPASKKPTPKPRKP